MENETKKIVAITVDGRELTKLPSDVQVNTEIIRNTERALDGTMCIDVVAVKAELTVVWALLKQAEYASVLRQFPKNGILNVKTGGNLLEEGDGGKAFYVEEVGGQPVFMDDLLYWQNVSVRLSEV